MLASISSVFLTRSTTFRNIETAVNTVKQCGKIVEGSISYTVSPVHNLELYVEMAKRLEDMGSDILCIKDMAGSFDAPGDRF